MGKKAQAILELALFAGLMLMILLTALSYQRNMREQKLADESVFAQAQEKALKHKFNETDIDGQEWECSGSIVSYSLTADRQANRIFQGGQRRTAGSSAAIYYSNAEDPPNLDYNYYNATSNTYQDIGSEVDSTLKRKLYYPRPGGTADPEDSLKLTTSDYIAIAYPLISNLLQGLFNVGQESWWLSWGGWLDFALRLAAYTYLTVKFYAALDEIEDSEAEREALEDLDEQMGEWGWRVCDKVHDGDAHAGIEYTKEITAQVYDIATEEPKSINYQETQTANSSNRQVTIGHQVERKISRRFDMTVPDPTIALTSHTFEDLAVKDVNTDLSGGQSETWSY